MGRRICFVAGFLFIISFCPVVLADGYAGNPDPEDTATECFPILTLTWTAGDYVAGYAPGEDANGHHVFLHTNFSWVNGANLDYPLGTAFGHYRAETASFSPTDPPVFGMGAPLAVEKTYYWLVIEVNDVNGGSPWKGPLWSFTTTSAKATNPSPLIGAKVGIYTGEVLNVELSWSPGSLVADINGHDVYLGTNQTAVTDATIGDGMGVYMGAVSDPCYLAEDLALDVMYYWRIDEFNDVLGTVKGTIWNFFADSGKAKVLSPADTETGFDPDQALTWTAGFAASSHDIYMGTDVGSLSSVEVGYPDTSYEPYMDLNTVYYWRIDEVNAVHPKSPWVGDVWSFTTHTGKAENPDPSNGQGGVYLNMKPSWTAAPRAATHDVYFGTDSPPPFAVNQGSTTYEPGPLSYAKTYYWRINEKQSGGETTTGDLWSFMTPDGPADVNITVDQSTVYQTIDGFGAHGAMNVWWSSGPFYNQNFLDLVIDDLGLTITRNEYYPKPNEPGQWPKQIPYLQAMKQKAEQSGEPLKFLATYWTPPHYMKDPPTCCGGYLLPEYYDDFGDYAVSSIQDYKDIGIDLYALSLQNEPAWPQSWNTCVYSTEEYRDMLKVAGPIIEASFPDTQLFLCEHMLFSFEFPHASYEYLIIQDPDALQWADIWATHGYGNDGQTPDPGSTETTFWTRARQLLEPTNRPFWMTETSGYDENWENCRQLAQSIYAALKYGHASAWVWWQLSENNGLGNPPGEYVLMNVGVPGKRYYISKQYYRYIRPEAVMVESDVDNSDVYIVAFKHPIQKTATIVLINADEQYEKLVQLDITGDILPRRFHVYRTTATENCVDAGIVARDGSVVLPENSVTTLYGIVPRNNFWDFADFAQEWRRSDCDAGNNWCNGTDSNQSGSVLLDDLLAFANKWLAND